MSHRKLKRSDFVGKTIKDVDCRAVNTISFLFTDGTALAIETETHAIVACDVCLSKKPRKRKEHAQP